MANPNKDSVDLAKDEALRQRKGGQAKQMILWFAALIVGAILGWLQVPALNELFNFVATVFTRLFQFIAVPTIALAVITTLSALGGHIGDKLLKKYPHFAAVTVTTRKPNVPISGSLDYVEVSVTRHAE